MAEGNTVDPEKMDALRRQIEGFLDYTWRMHSRNNIFGIVLLVLGISLGTVATILGFSGKGVAAGTVSAVITLLIGFQKAFNFSERADFFRIIHTEAKGLRDHLTYKVRSTEQLESAVDALKALRDQTARKLPKGQSMEEVLSPAFRGETEKRRAKGRQ